MFQLIKKKLVSIIFFKEIEPCSCLARTAVFEDILMKGVWAKSFRGPAWIRKWECVLTSTASIHSVQWCCGANVFSDWFKTCLMVVLSVALFTICKCLMNFTLSPGQVIIISKLDGFWKNKILYYCCFIASTKLNLKRQCTGNWQGISLEPITYLLNLESLLQFTYVFPGLYLCNHNESGLSSSSLPKVDVSIHCYRQPPSLVIAVNQKRILESLSWNTVKRNCRGQIFHITSCSLK